VVAEEQFGPVLPLIATRDDDAAVAQANATEYGLSGSVWSRDTARAVALAGRLECGRSYVNAHAASPLGNRHMPFGGHKQSGMGWENGVYGVAAFVQYHAINHPRV
jgi:aldehyde dehydrogenase